MRLLVFNPENDLALAANDFHYTPPASAISMARDLRDLPRLWAKPDDYVWHHYDSDIPSDILHSITEVQPWGWSPLLLAQLRKAGLADSLLPSPLQMAEFRNATGRELSQKLLHDLHYDLGNTAITGMAVRCDSLDQIHTVHTQFGHSIMKAPWSGSGRGIHPVTAPSPTEKDKAWAARCLQRQGYVMLEPFYDKVMDLAFEFWQHHDGSVSYEGLSLFQTTAGGVYAGNIVCSEQQKEDTIGRYVDSDTLLKVRNALIIALQRHTHTFYSGPIGVDMMVVRQDGYKLHPCVEVNVRMTMGYLALQLAHNGHYKFPSLFQIRYTNGSYQAKITPIGTENSTFC
ncbi:MAG: hypothetical protein J5486_07180 [Bacteroidaceae bacterium]|nr:hypothetical protein [Bacteroidaceae bacterium]